MSDGLEAVLLRQLLDEYGEDAETWTALRSVKRIADAIRAAGWEKAPGRAERAEDAAVRASGGDVALRDLRQRLEALVAEWDHPAEVYALRMSAAPRLHALLAVTDGGCGDKSCDEEHGEGRSR